LGTDRKERIKKYYRYLYNKESAKFVIPREIKQKFETFQRKFGSSVDELNNEDYKKYLELEKLKKTTGNEIAPNHPLLMELNQKLQKRLTPEEEAKLDEMSA
jgi:regulator of replication initiation timing